MKQQYFQGLKLRKSNNSTLSKAGKRIDSMSKNILMAQCSTKVISKGKKIHFLLCRTNIRLQVDSFLSMIAMVQLRTG